MAPSNYHYELTLRAPSGEIYKARSFLTFDTPVPAGEEKRHEKVFEAYAEALTNDGGELIQIVTLESTAYCGVRVPRDN